MKKVLSIFLFFGLFFAVQAQNKGNKNAKHEVLVEGVCGMCKQRIEKAAYGVKGVKMATWDPVTKELSLILNERITNLGKVEHAIAAVGHDTERVKADDEVYHSINDCCQYRNPDIEMH
ncbi:Heavy-metal-associated domain [Weeksella virosa]|uniref:heavy-metal-associated domain-containing protein n=1 Tax=Weeksella virosa TaxID=1014 RepID=UPI000E033425|nr:heavy-metal-associated domain-containing protein [Weeksella virosa]SUP53345.1 Heavy-metal-associated domain [Weeksella virosa]